MELYNISEHTNTFSVKPMFSIILYTCSWIFAFLQSVALDDIWMWLWRGLSLISLLLIIYINWSKAKKIFKGKRRR